VRSTGSEDELLAEAEILVAEASGTREPTRHVPSVLRPNLNRGETRRRPRQPSLSL